MTEVELTDEVEERFQVLENKVIYQEHTVDELNSVLIRQQDQIDSLLNEVRKLRTMMSESGERNVDGGEEPPPPHY